MNKGKKRQRSGFEKILMVAIFTVILSVIGVYGISSKISSKSNDDSLQSMLTSAENFKGVLSDYQSTTDKVLSRQEDAETLKIIERLKKDDTEGMKVVFLTFDDGPSIYTEDVLDVLKSYNVRATFFSKRGDESLVQDLWPRLIAEGHTLANHTWSHSYELYDTPDAFYADVQAEEDFQKSITGTEPSGLFRFPGGSLTANETCVRGILDRGYNYADWNVSSTDASAEPPSPEAITDAVVSGCHNHEVSVVLCHAEVKENTRTALPSILETLLSEGYTFLPMEKDISYPRQLEV